MTEKEKKAINNLKEIIELVEEELKNNNKNTNAVLDIVDLKSLDIVLNLVNKQLSEIKQKDKQIDLMAEVMYKSNTAQLLIEYGIENKEQLIKEFEKLAKEKGGIV